MSPASPLASAVDASDVERAKRLAPIGGGVGGALGAAVGATVAGAAVDAALLAGAGAGLGAVLVWVGAAVLE